MSNRSIIHEFFNCDNMTSITFHNNKCSSGIFNNIVMVNPSSIINIVFAVTKTLVHRTQRLQHQHPHLDYLDVEFEFAQKK